MSDASTSSSTGNTYRNHEDVPRYDSLEGFIRVLKEIAPQIGHRLCRMINTSAPVIGAHLAIQANLPDNFLLFDHTQKLSRSLLFTQTLVNCLLDVIKDSCAMKDSTVAQEAQNNVDEIFGHIEDSIARIREISVNMANNRTLPPAAPPVSIRRQ